MTTKTWLLDLLDREADKVDLKYAAGKLDYGDFSTSKTTILRAARLVFEGPEEPTVKP